MVFFKRQWNNWNDNVVKINGLAWQKFKLSRPLKKLQLVRLFTAIYVRRVIDRDDVVSPCMGYENKLKYYKGDDDISEQETWEITYINISSPIF